MASIGKEEVRKCSYSIPIKNEGEYYYNEMTVPEGYDPIGSYFAVFGFASGPFGIQVGINNKLFF